MKTIVFLVVFLGVGFCFAKNTNSPIILYGTWEFYRFVDVGGSITDIKKVIGQKINFEKGQMQFPEKGRESFLGLPNGVMSDVSYEWEKIDIRSDNYIRGEGTDELPLFRFGPLDEESSPYVYLLKASSEVNRFLFCFELTKKGELVYYCDGHICFFRKKFKTKPSP